MNPSEVARLIADATPPPTLAGEAFAEDDLYADMTDPVTRATWTESGLRLFLAHVREAYGEEFYQRITSVQQIESDGTQGDPPSEVITTDCATCEGPSAITGVEWPPWLNGFKHYRLACHHLARA